MNVRKDKKCSLWSYVGKITVNSWCWMLTTVMMSSRLGRRSPIVSVWQWENVKLTIFINHVEMYFICPVGVAPPFSGKPFLTRKKHVYISWQVKNNSLKHFLLFPSHTNPANQNLLLYFTSDPSCLPPEVRIKMHFSKK